MPDSSTLQALVAAANANLSDPERNRVMRPRDGETVRFELYHAVLSICSQKVRAVLAEKKEPYTLHKMVIVAGHGIFTDDFKPAENYRPSYVRLRMFGGAQLGKSYAEQHTGRSSVETEGFDPCVVPLLVDHTQAKVVVDSKLICEHLDREISGPQRLIPADPTAAQEVMKQVSIVDQTPHPGILYGFHPDDDRRPDFMKAVMKDVHEGKRQALQMFIDANSDDAELVKAYQSKIAKEQAGKALAFDPERQRAVRAEVDGIIKALAAQLETYANPWICGKEYTLADVVWGISLYRIHWLGLAYLWKDLPWVQEYAQRVYKRPCVWEAVINWPSPMPPSPHTADIS